MISDFRLAARALGAARGYTALAALTLALGVGASTALFSAVDGVLLRPLPYADAERVVTVWQRDARAGEARGEVAPGNFVDLRERARSFAPLAAAEEYGLDYLGPDGPETFRTWQVTEGFFEALGARAAAGRLPRREDYAPGAPRVVVLGDGLWRRRFGADPGVVGRSLTLDGEPATVVGVLPAAFRFPDARDVWAPRPVTAELREQRGSGYWTVVGRLRPGVTVGLARREVSAVMAALAAEHPRANAGVGGAVVPLAEQILGGVRPALVLLLAAAGVVLLVACANVANLALARALARRQELTVRAALGAGRLRLARQLAAECLLLSALGGALGVLVAAAAVDVLRALSPAGLPRADEIVVDARALLFAAAASLASACLFGVAPALWAARGDLHAWLRVRQPAGSPGRGRAGGLPNRRAPRALARSGLVVGQVALSVVLLVGAGLLARSFAALLAVDRGFDARGVAAATAFAWQPYPDGPRRAEFAREVVARLAAAPGVAAAGATSSLPLASPIGRDDAAFRVDGRPAPAEGEAPEAHVTAATPGYFAALGIAARRGRLFAPTDDARATPVVVINEALARRHFPDEDPVGRRLTFAFFGPPRAWEVVGVVPNVRQSSLEADPRPALFVPHAQAPTGALTFVARAAAQHPPAGAPADAAPLVERLKREIWAVNGSMPVYESTTLDALLAGQVRERRFHLALLGAFALCALALAAVGVYGALSFAAGERRQEIGVRLALGAVAGDVVSLVTRDGVRLAAAGVLLGTLAAAASARALAGLLYGVRPLDAATFLAVALGVLAVGTAASLLPARRASRADPAGVLRGE